jgi:hypothetical protein
MAYFEKVITRSYTDVDTAHGINTGQFLEATDGMINMFGKHTRTFFWPI